MTFQTKLTAIGAAKIAAAQLGGPPVELVSMAIGDGDGYPVDPPTGLEVDLVNSVHLDTLASLEISTSDPTVIVAELVIPIEEGGWTIRELGLIDSDGDLFAYGNFPDSYKTVPADGVATEMLVRAEIRVASAEDVNISVNPDLILASRAWAEVNFLRKNQNLADIADPATALANIGAAPLASPIFTGNPTAPTPAPGDIDTSIATTAFVVAAVGALALLAVNNLSDIANPATARANIGAAPLASPIFTGNPTAPTPAPGDNDTSIATTAFVKAAITALIDASPAALDTLNELAAALGDDANFAATMANALALKAPLASPAFTGAVDIGGRVKSGVTVPAASQIDCAAGNYFTKTAAGALTWTVANVPPAGAYHFILELTNGGLGAQTWMAGTKWPGGYAPNLASAGIDVLIFITDDGGATWRGSLAMKDSK